MAIVSRPIHTQKTVGAGKGRFAFQPASNVNHSFHPETTSSPNKTKALQHRSTAPMQPQLQAQVRQQSSSPPVIAKPRRSAPPSSSRVMSHFDQKKRTQSLTPTSGVDSMADTTSKRSTRSMDGSTQTAESWRKHGKKFRANLVLVDDAQGDNVFTLSESCTIERYYRVADRVSAHVFFVCVVDLGRVPCSLIDFLAGLATIFVERHFQARWHGRELFDW